MPSMHDKFHWVTTFHAFRTAFLVKTPKTLAECGATCLRCPNSFKFCMKANHEHGHILTSFGVISCMARSISCSKVMVQVGWLDALFHINKMDSNLFHTLVSPCQASKMNFKEHSLRKRSEFNYNLIIDL